jgi:L-threonylcarbamoyladenylate synthase
MHPCMHVCVRARYCLPPWRLAGPSIPPSVTAGTGLVGVRVPRSSIALALLAAARLPVAAPSANRFGHVSPTSAAHVLADLGSHPIGVIDGGGGGGGEGCCAVGIESTVLRVDAGARTLVVYRRGGVSTQGALAALEAAGIHGYTARVVSKATAPPAAAAAAADAGAGAAAPVGEVAPGQLLTHYAPDVETRLVVRVVEGSGGEGGGGGVADATDSGAALEVAMGKTVVVDFAGSLAFVRPRALAYRDMSAGCVRRHCVCVCVCVRVCVCACVCA